MRALLRQVYRCVILTSVLCSTLTTAYGVCQAAQRAPKFDSSQIVVHAGNPQLLVDGQPFYFYGAAFFYERIPASRWRASLKALRRLGFNTLDLYIPWNWHELADGEFDFDGHTDPRRNLQSLLALARTYDFRFIVRPGPVIRNEWRNGGYPDWLLTRPEYRMPLHDVLEGRYPATATLQNAHSDDAAAQWLGNATHMRYASRWLRTALHEFVPVADRVLAVQLDDDQGAYIDNQTWPAPHLQRYLRTLEAVVRSVVGVRLPVFLNTYEMKVTASAPTWAMGNWYQSDAYSIGEHDRAALEFSAGLLQTQAPRYPLAISEFQAGWLAPPQDPLPRPADPTNTTLALHTLLGLGMRGTVVFPAQDTVNPAGWEAPFANRSYAWDAALDVDLVPSNRYAPTKRFGDLVRDYGAQLAATRRVADGAIAYLTSAYHADKVTNADLFAIVARTQTAQHQCRLRRLTCDLVDLRYSDDAELARYPFLIVPATAITRSFLPFVTRRLQRYRLHGGRVVSGPPASAVPRTGGLSDATLLVSPHHVAFLDVVNYDSRPRVVPKTALTLPSGETWRIPRRTIAARDALLLQWGSHMPDTQQPDLPRTTPIGSSTARAFRAIFGPLRMTANGGDSAGNPPVTLRNERLSFTLEPAAGARAFSLQGRLDNDNVVNAFTSVGALRDNVSIQPPLSVSDRIGKYTRLFPAGMFNRPYRVSSKSEGSGEATAAFNVDYVAPDVLPAGAHFTRRVSLGANDDAIEVDERADFGDQPLAMRQRGVRYDSFNTRGAETIDLRRSGCVGFYFSAAHYAAFVAWQPREVESAAIVNERSSAVIRLVFAPQLQTRTRYGILQADSHAIAQAALLKEQTVLEAKLR